MRKKQHPLILAMNKFDALFTDLDDASYEAFTAYVQDQVSTRRRNRAITHPKSPSAADKRRAKMICVDCHLPSADRIHTDESNSAHHPFVLDHDESPPSAPRAAKKSSSEKQPKLAGVLNTEVETVSVGSVGGNGD